MYPTANESLLLGVACIILGVIAGVAPIVAAGVLGAFGVLCIWSSE